MAVSEVTESLAAAPAPETTPGPAQPDNASAPTPASDQKTEKPQGKQKPGKQAPNGGAEAQAATNGEAKLSGKELKLRAKAEKEARRAREKAEKAAVVAPPAVNGASSGGKADAAGQKPQQQQQQGGQKGGQDAKAQNKRSGGAPSQTGGSQPMAMRRRPSQAGVITKETKKVENKHVGLFGHLYNQPRRDTIEGVSKEVHPAVLALGFQMSSYQVCGSTARCVAMLLAFKKAIQSYTTPVGSSLARHLTSHYLSPQIEYLKSHRPISVSMGNAIRWLKDYIIHIDPDTPENIAKADICDSIDQFIRERLTVASTAIADKAASKIKPGSTIVTYAKSSVVEQTLLLARQKGVTDFRVIVIENRPLLESRNLARSLAGAGIRVTYLPYTAASHAFKDADLALLGAHAMMANGRLYSRVGTAAVAMHAHMRDVPVIVCCEKIKFTDRVALDSIVLNEVAPSEELLLGDDVGEGGKGGVLQGWKESKGLQLLNILYDVTPAEYISMVVTEDGFLPPSSVPVVHRLMTERDVRA